MDPLTHVMAGALIGHTGAAFCPEPAATLTAVAAAILPDIDFYARKYEGSRFLKVHHGATHSFVGILAQSALVAVPAWLFFTHVRIFDSETPSLMVLSIISLLSVTTHIFLDWIMHNNGLPLLWPFAEKRFCLPLILGVNPRTVSHECGEKHYLTCFGCQSRGGFLNPVSWIIVVPGVTGFFTPQWRTMIGLLPWLVTALYLTLCYASRESARRVVMRLDPDMRVAPAYPARSRPDRWLFVRETADGTVAILGDSLKKASLRRWNYARERLSRPIENAVATIRNNLTSTIRHLHPVEIPTTDGTVVEFRDLSYLSAEPTEIGTIRVYLDQNHTVLKEVYQEIW